MGGGVFDPIHNAMCIDIRTAIEWGGEACVQLTMVTISKYLPDSELDRKCALLCVFEVALKGCPDDFLTQKHRGQVLPI